MCSLNFHFSLWIPSGSLRLLEGECTSRFNLYLFADIFTSPERESDLHDSLYNNYTQSNYFTIKQKKHHGSSLINELYVKNIT